MSVRASQSTKTRVFKRNNVEGEEIQSVIVGKNRAEGESLIISDGQGTAIAKIPFETVAACAAVSKPRDARQYLVPRLVLHEDDTTSD